MKAKPGGAILELLLFLVVGAVLLGAALRSHRFVPEPPEEAVNLPRPALEPRDQFYGGAVPAAGVLWLVGNHGKILRSDDAGESWIAQPTPVDENLQDLAAWDRDRAVAVGNDGVVLVTRDAGESWERVEAPRSEIVSKLFRVVARPGGEAWAVGAGGMILSSGDGGATWDRRSGIEDVAWNGIAFAGDGRAIVVGEFGRIQRSEDGGETWFEVESPVERSLMGVAFRSPERAVAVGLDGLVLHSADAGVTWRPASIGTTAHLYDVLWRDDHWVVVGDGGLLVTGRDDGWVWEVQPLGDHELGWHTEGLVTEDGVALVGASQGIWNGEWRRFSG